MGAQLVGQLGGATYTVALKSKYAYIGVGPRLVMLDVNTPSSPVVVGQIAVFPGVVNQVVVSGDYAYIAAGEEGGLRIMDISNPTSPMEIS